LAVGLPTFADGIAVSLLSFFFLDAMIMKEQLAKLQTMCEALENIVEFLQRAVS
jgi:hypothetical protein